MSARTPMVCLDCNTPPRAVTLDLDDKAMVACECYQVAPSEIGDVKKWTSDLDTTGERHE